MGSFYSLQHAYANLGLNPMDPTFHLATAQEILSENQQGKTCDWNLIGNSQIRIGLALLQQAKLLADALPKTAAQEAVQSSIEGTARRLEATVGWERGERNTSVLTAALNDIAKVTPVQQLALSAGSAGLSSHTKSDDSRSKLKSKARQRVVLKGGGGVFLYHISDLLPGALPAIATGLREFNGELERVVYNGLQQAKRSWVPVKDAEIPTDPSELNLFYFEWQDGMMMEQQASCERTGACAHCDGSGAHYIA
jgi:hypothetical protein